MEYNLEQKKNNNTAGRNKRTINIHHLKKKLLLKIQRRLCDISSLTHVLYGD